MDGRRAIEDMLVTNNHLLFLVIKQGHWGLGLFGRARLGLALRGSWKGLEEISKDYKNNHK